MTSSERSAVWIAAHDAVWIEIPKVACSSIKVALAALLGLEVEVEAAGGDPHAVDFPQPPRSRAASEERLYPASFAFAFVRNPWDRLVSCYRDKIGGEVDDFTGFDERRGVAYCLARFDAFTRGMSFEAFVDAVAAIPDAEADEHFRSQVEFLSTSAGRLGVDFVGRFERLSEDWARVVAELGLPRELQLPHLQAARRSARYAEFYDERTRRLAADRYAKDIEAFGYRFDR